MARVYFRKIVIKRVILIKLIRISDIVCDSGSSPKTTIYYVTLILMY